MRGTDRWEEVGAHGHAVATVLSGAVLDRITGGRYKACRHRVVMASPQLGAATNATSTAHAAGTATGTASVPPPAPASAPASAPVSASAGIGIDALRHAGAFGGRHRIAATFFFRPAPSAKLTPPPCLAQTRLRPDGKS
jgi:isopenicillin N synthase-like dioxygenase